MGGVLNCDAVGDRGNRRRLSLATSVCSMEGTNVETDLEIALPRVDAALSFPHCP